MTIVLLDPDLPISIASDLRREAPSDIDITLPTTPLEAEDFSGIDVFISSNGTWDDQYMTWLEAGSWVQTLGAGYDRYPLKRFESAGITFTNAPINTESVCEHVFALLLTVTRQIQTALTQQRDHVWDRSFGPQSLRLATRRLTIVGLGRIGDAVAERAATFDMDVYGIKRRPDTYSGVLPAGKVHNPNELDAHLPETDVLVLTVPLTDGTRNLLDEERISRLPETAIVINVSRGGVLNQTALTKALEVGSLGGAGLDVFEQEPLPEDSPLWGLENAVVSPHVAGHFSEYSAVFGEYFIQLYERWQAGEAFGIKPTC